MHLERELVVKQLLNELFRRKMNLILCCLTIQSYLF